MKFELLNRYLKSLNYNSVEELVSEVNKYTEIKYDSFDDFALDYLKDARENRDMRQLERAILYIYPKSKHKQELLKIMHELLLEGWHPWHEYIVFTLEGYDDISSIDYLFKVFSIKTDDREKHDYYYPLHKNTMWAIYKIGGEECKDRL